MKINPEEILLNPSYKVDNFPYFISGNEETDAQNHAGAGGFCAHNCVLPPAGILGEVIPTPGDRCNIPSVWD